MFVGEEPELSEPEEPVSTEEPEFEPEFEPESTGGLLAEPLLPELPCEGALPLLAGTSRPSRRQ